MTLRELKDAIQDMEHLYDYDESTEVHVKDQDGKLVELIGFFVGEGGKIFLR